jgi:hypothetical protein
LIPNPNFEEKLHCPPYALGSSFMDATAHWFCPQGSIGTSDYYHTCDTTTNPYQFGVPNSWTGFQEDPSFGNAYIGFVNYSEGWPTPIGPMGVEYVQVKLLDTLLLGQSYYVHFLYNFSDNRYTRCKNVGIRFSDTSLVQSNVTHGTLGFDTLRTLEDTTIVTSIDTVSWFSFDTIYTAQGGETYITLGNFRDISTSSFVSYSSQGYSISYVFVDNVYVSPVPPTVGCMDSTSCTFNPNADINDSTLCHYVDVNITYDSDTLSANTALSNSILWSTGSQSNSIIVDTNGTYWLIATNNIGCSDTAWINVNWLSIKEQTPTLSIRPNPVFDYLYINYTEETKIYNLLGKLQLTSNEQKIDVSNLKAGVYILKAGKQRMKFMKK